ncbi:unnamed protein product [Choristocarpus tenellus]
MSTCEVQTMRESNTVVRYSGSLRHAPREEGKTLWFDVDGSATLSQDWAWSQEYKANVAESGMVDTISVFVVPGEERIPDNLKEELPLENSTVNNFHSDSLLLTAALASGRFQHSTGLVPGVHVMCLTRKPEHCFSSDAYSDEAESVPQSRTGMCFRDVPTEVTGFWPRMTHSVDSSWQHLACVETLSHVMDTLWPDVSWAFIVNAEASRPWAQFSCPEYGNRDPACFVARGSGQEEKSDVAWLHLPKTSTTAQEFSTVLTKHMTHECSNTHLASQRVALQAHIDPGGNLHSFAEVHSAVVGGGMHGCAILSQVGQVVGGDGKSEARGCPETGSIDQGVECQSQVQERGGGQMHRDIPRKVVFVDASELPSGEVLKQHEETWFGVSSLEALEGGGLHRKVRDDNLYFCVSCAYSHIKRGRVDVGGYWFSFCVASCVCAHAIVDALGIFLWEESRPLLSSRKSSVGIRTLNYDAIHKTFCSCSERTRIPQPSRGYCVFG